MLNSSYGLILTCFTSCVDEIPFPTPNKNGKRKREIEESDNSAEVKKPIVDVSKRYGYRCYFTRVIMLEGEKWAVFGNGLDLVFGKRANRLQWPTRQKVVLLC